MTSLQAKLRRGAELIAASLFAVMFGAFIIQVVSRYVFDDPVSWSLEVCSITYVWIVFLASATILKPREHITFDMLYATRSAKWKRYFAIFTTACILAVFLYCLPTTIGYVIFSARHHTPIMGIRLDIIYSCFALFMIGAIIGSALRLRRLLSKSWQADL
ncbi:MAG TPA: TRAP transporter small permease subunit [Candidatus Polarisedimenticolia bacterium]|nr:TRAP transporter small permease subunit [Candidatus Polarisedimenticolia bacterium]